MMCEIAVLWTGQTVSKAKLGFDPNYCYES